MSYSKNFISLATEFKNSIQELQKNNKSQELLEELQDYIDILNEIHPQDLENVLIESKVFNEFQLWKKQYDDKLNRMEMFKIEAQDGIIILKTNDKVQSFPLINIYDYIESTTPKTHWKFYVLMAFFSQAHIFEIFQIAEAVKI